MKGLSAWEDVQKLLDYTNIKVYSEQPFRAFYFLWFIFNF